MTANKIMGNAQTGAPVLFTMLAMLWAMLVILVIPALALVATYPNDAVAAPNKAQKDSAELYAYGLDIEASGKNSRLLFTLPKEVYQYARHANLADLRVFNKEGDILQFGRFDPEEAKSKTTVRHQAKIYPLWNKAEPRPKDEAKPVADPIAWSPPAGKEFAALIVELQPQDHHLPDNSSITHIYVTPATFPVGYQSKISISQSTDLKSWLDNGIQQQALVWLGGDKNNRVANNQLEVQVNPDTRYLKLQWDEGVPIKIARVDYQIETWHKRPPSYQAEFSASTIGAESGDWLYHVWPAINNDRVNFLLPEGNSNLHLVFGSYRNSYDTAPRTGMPQLSGRPEQGQNLSTRRNFITGGSGDFFRLKKDDTEEVNAPMKSTFRAREWVVHATQANSDVVNTAVKVDNLPRLQLQWRPERYYVIGSGSMPYRLVFGRQDGGETPLSRPPVSTNSNDYEEVKLVRLTSNLMLIKANNEAAAQALASKSRNTWLFWLILSAGVVLMMYFAYSLYKTNQKLTKP